MDHRTIPPTTSSPAVEMNPETGRLSIVGESYPSNSYEFFRPIIDWLTDYLSLGRRVLLEVELSYLNTSSIKCMLDILELLDRHVKSGAPVEVRWYYDPDNHRALELVEEFREDLTLTFEVIARPSR